MSTSTRRIELPERFEVGFLRGLDRRTELYQRLNAVYEAVVDDVGGIDGLSHTKLALIERFVFLEAVLQAWEKEIATNPKATEHLVSRWIQAVNSLQGLARHIGLERSRQRVVSLKAYVAGSVT